MSKHWGYQQVWTMLNPILFFCGDTAELYMRMNSCLSWSIYPYEDMYVICNCFLEEDLKLMGSENLHSLTCIWTYGLSFVNSLPLPVLLA